MTQDAVARRLEVSRSTVAQMELGNRAVTSLELDRLATLYGRDLREFLAEEFHGEDALVALFRAHPDVAEQERVVDALRGCVALGREVTNLERLLGIDRDLGTVAVYPMPAPVVAGRPSSRASRSPTTSACACSWASRRSRTWPKSWKPRGSGPRSWTCPMTFQG